LYFLILIFMYRPTLRVALPVTTVLVVGALSVIALFATTTPSISTPTAGGHSGSSISTVSGSGGSGETISVYSGSTLLGTGQIDASGSYSVAISPILDNMTISLTPIADDGMGAVATGSTVTVTHDNIAPTASVIYSQTGITNQDVIATLTGSSETITVTSV
jgi:large repetitive protein